MNHDGWVTALGQKGLFTPGVTNRSNGGFAYTWGQFRGGFEAKLRSGPLGKKLRRVKVKDYSVFEQGLQDSLKALHERHPNLRKCKVFLSRFDIGDCNILYFMEVLLQRAGNGNDVSLQLLAKHPECPHRYSEYFD